MNFLFKRLLADSILTGMIALLLFMPAMTQAGSNSNKIHADNGIISLRMNYPQLQKKITEVNTKTKKGSIALAFQYGKNDQPPLQEINSKFTQNTLSTKLKISLPDAKAIQKKIGVHLKKMDDNDMDFSWALIKHKRSDGSWIFVTLLPVNIQGSATSQNGSWIDWFIPNAQAYGSSTDSGNGSSSGGLTAGKAIVIGVVVGAIGGVALASGVGPAAAAAYVAVTGVGPATLFASIGAVLGGILGYEVGETIGEAAEAAEGTTNALDSVGDTAEGGGATPPSSGGTENVQQTDCEETATVYEMPDIDYETGEIGGEGTGSDNNPYGGDGPSGCAPGDTTSGGQSPCCTSRGGGLSL